MLPHAQWLTILLYTKLTKVSNSKVTSTVTKGHWQSCHSTGHHNYRNYAFILHCFRDSIAYLQKFKEITWPWPRLLERQIVTLVLTRHVANHCTKFDNSSFSHFWYIPNIASHGWKLAPVWNGTGVVVYDKSQGSVATYLKFNHYKFFII